MRQVSAVLVRRGRSWWVAIALILVALLTIGLYGEADRQASSTDALPAGMDSTKVVELEAQLPQEDDSTAVVLFTADSGELTEEALTKLRQAYPDRPVPGLVVSEDKTAALAVVPVREEATEIADKVTEIREQAADIAPDGVTSQVTGPGRHPGGPGRRLRRRQHHACSWPPPRSWRCCC